MINILEKLETAPIGTKLYTTTAGEVTLKELHKYMGLSIKVLTKNGRTETFTKFGTKYKDGEGETILFPSKENRDWENFIPSHEKYNFKVFEKVLVRDFEHDNWRINFFERMSNNQKEECKYKCMFNSWVQCIPFNDETEHLAGKTGEAPIKYINW